MEDVENLLKCKCGSILFAQEMAATYDESKFIIYAGAGAKLMPYDNTIPYGKCIACGRISVPRTSFNGRNRLDRIVQVYEQLLQDVDQLNLSIDLKEKNLELAHSHYGQEPKKVEDVETEPASGTDTEDVVRSSTGRAGRKQNNKKPA